MAFRTRRFRGRRRRRGRRYSRGSGLTSSLARRRTLSTRPFGRASGSLAPRKMYTKLESVHYFHCPSQTLPANGNKACALILTCPWDPAYSPVTAVNGFGAGYTRGTQTNAYPVGWQNYYGLYKQFVVTGVKYHIKFLYHANSTAGQSPSICSILPIPAAPMNADTTMFPTNAYQAETVPNARSAHVAGQSVGGTCPMVSFKGYIPMAVLVGQDVYDDRFYQNTFPTSGTQANAVQGAMSTLGLYWSADPNQTAATVPPMIRVSLRTYATFFDLRMLATTT